MRRIAILLAALACAAPAVAQAQQESNGPDPTHSMAEQLEQQRNEAALVQQAFRDGDFKTARKYAERLSAEAPTNVSVWLMLGQAEAGLMNWSGSSRAYATAVRVAPSNIEAHAGLGVALGQRGNKAAAKQLEWLTAKAQACGASCGNIGKLKSDVEAAIAAGAKAG